MNEPKILKSRKIKSFSTFEEMENDQLTYYAGLPPEELLKNHKVLSMAAFGFKTESELTKPDRKVKFDKV